MKNIFLTLALLLTVSFAFATHGIEKVKPSKIEKGISKTSITSLIKVVNYTHKNRLLVGSLEIENTNIADYPCRWRICTYVNGVKVGCTPWEYGECLPPVQL